MRFWQALSFYPPAFSIGRGTSLEQKRAALEQYADDVILRMR